MQIAGMETVVIVAIGVLAAIFVASVIGVVIACKHKYCKPIDLISRQLQHNDPDQNLVENMEVEPAPRGADGLELDNVTITNWEQILSDQNWVHDATGLAPHCLAILKTTHVLTEKLVGMTMGNSQQLRNPEALSDLVVIAKRIGPRVDDVVKAMYPPLDPRLLEARCSALILSVSHLVMVTKNACRLSGVLDWIDQSLADVEDHLRVLHEASSVYEAMMRSQTSNTTHKEAASTSLTTEDGSTVTVTTATTTATLSVPSGPSQQQPLPECIPNQDSNATTQRNESSEV